jgi:hypothetical protein
MAHFSTTKLVPSTAELWGCVVFGILLGLVGNTHVVLQRYGLSSSAATINDHAGSLLSKGLTQLDSYRFTDTVVTFLVWAAVGLFVLSIIQSLLRAQQEFREHEAVSSNAYIHPQNFSRTIFWQKVVIQSVASFAALILFIAALIICIIYILPLGLVYVQTLVTHVTALNALYALLGFTILAIMLVILDVLFRVVRFRRQLFQG